MRGLGIVVLACACGKSDAVGGMITLTGEAPVVPVTCVDAARTFGMRPGARAFSGPEPAAPGKRVPMLAVWDGPDAAIVYYTADTEGDNPLIVDAHSCSEFAFGDVRVMFRCEVGDRELRADLRHGDCP